MKRMFFIGFLFALMSCEVASEPINYGKDGCNYCSMTIVEKNYGTELVTKKGKVYKFDSMECLINSTLEDNKNFEEFAYILTNTNNSDGVLKNANECIFMINDKLPSPMGANLTAFQNEKLANETQQKIGGKLYSWNELITMFKAQK